MLSIILVLSTVCTFITTISAGSITFQNRSPSPICYKVEYTAGNIAETNSICDYTPAFWVNSTQNLTIYPQANGKGLFDGAITAIALNGFKGSRHEINYQVDPDGTPVTWYDVDFEMGISNSTLGPKDHRNCSNGQPSLTGERNALEKANIAWNELEDKTPLAPHYYYVEQGPHGNLSKIRIDKAAPFEILYFFQMYANLSGYVGHGSVEGVYVDALSRNGRFVTMADKKTTRVDTHDLEIIAY